MYIPLEWNGNPSRHESCEKMKWVILMNHRRRREGHERIALIGVFVAVRIREESRTVRAFSVSLRNDGRVEISPSSFSHFAHNSARFYWTTLIIYKNSRIQADLESESLIIVRSHQDHGVPFLDTSTISLAQLVIFDKLITQRKKLLLILLSLIKFPKR